MIPRTRQMHREATYWAPTNESDGFSRVGFVAPVLCRVRWEGKCELFRDSNGRERTSSAIVYNSIPTQEGGFLALGDYLFQVNPREVEGAREIGAAGCTDNLRGNQTLHKSWLV